MIFLQKILAELSAVSARELKQIWQDKKLRNLLLLAPLINALIVCGVYAPSYVTEVPIAVVQQDASALTQRMVRWLDQHQKLQVTAKVFDLASAETLFMQGKIAGYVVFEKDFSQRLKRNEDARVLLFCDAGNMVLANTLNSAVQGIVQTFSVGLAVQKARRLGAFKEQAQALVMPIRAEVRPIGNPGFSYADFMLPGLLLAVLQQVILLGLALTWAGERENKSWSELQALSSRPWVLLLGKNLPHFVIHFFWLLLFFSLILPLSQVSGEGQWSSLLIFSILFVAVIIGWGSWVSILIGDKLGATQTLMFLAVPSFLLSGYTWPAAAMPKVLQLMSEALPLTHSAIMLRKIYGSGLGITAFPREICMLLLFLLGHALFALWAVRRVSLAKNNSTR